MFDGITDSSHSSKNYQSSNDSVKMYLKLWAKCVGFEGAFKQDPESEESEEHYKILGCSTKSLDEHKLERFTAMEQVGDLSEHAVGHHWGYNYDSASMSEPMSTTDDYEKSKVNLFMEKKKEAVSAILGGNLPEFIQNFEETGTKDGKRRGKKTSKMQSFMDEVAETSKPTTPKKRKTNSPSKDRDVDSPSKNTRLQKSAATYGQETQRLQAMEYFKKKKAIQMQQPMSSSSSSSSSPSPPQPRPLSPLPQSSSASLQPHESSLLPPPPPSLLKPCQLLPEPKLLQPTATCMPGHHIATFQENQSWDFPSSSSSLSNTSSVVAQSYSTLLESPSVCGSCDLYKYQLDRKDEEIQRLQAEIDCLRTMSDRQEKQNITDLLNELNGAIRRYEEKTTNRQIYEPHESNETVGHIPQESSMSSLPVSSTKSVPEDSGQDSDHGFEEHFLPGENKVKLVQSYDLFIDSTKLQAMRIKAKKNPSRMLRDLLMYYFEPKYLASHSATGTRSPKKGLPLAVIQPIREFICSQFRCEDVNSLINRKCLDIARSLKIQTTRKDKPASADDL